MKYCVAQKGFPIQWFETREEAEDACMWWQSDCPLGEFTVGVEK